MFQGRNIYETFLNETSRSYVEKCFEKKLPFTAFNSSTPDRRRQMLEELTLQLYAAEIDGLCHSIAYAALSIRVILR